MAGSHPLRAAVVQRQHIVLGRLGIEQQLEVVQLVGILVRKVDGLAEVLRDVIQLPLVAVDHIDPLELGLVLPGPAVRRGGAGHPAVVIDGAVAKNLEILRVARGGRLGVVEGVGHAHALDGFLRHPVDAWRAARCR